LQLTDEEHEWLAGDLPETPGSVVFRIDPVEGYFLDYSKGFTHRDMATY
jgi:hypothetical protein